LAELDLDRTSAVVLLSALGLLFGVLFFAFAGVETPLWNDDGPYHTEIIDAYRQGGQPRSQDRAYPHGYHLLTAAILQLAPWVDSAYGTFWTSLAFAPLGILAIFAFGAVVWRVPFPAPLGALLAVFTFQFPFNPHFWGFWPLAAGMVLSLTIWTCAVRYFEAPTPRWAIAGGVLAAGVVLVHGTEVYTVLVGLLLILIGCARRLSARMALRDMTLAAGVAAALAAPYLPTLFGWAGAGGAVAGSGHWESALAELGVEDKLSSLIALVLVSTSTGVGLDLLVRLGLFFAAAWWALRRRDGRILIGFVLVFFALGWVFTLGDASIVRRVYALTFPWGERDRMAMTAAAVTPLLQGGALAALCTWKLPSISQLERRQRMLIFAAVLGIVALGALVFVDRLAAQVRAMTVYRPEDAAAMAWLRQHAKPGEAMANDWMADAGIWSPYKSGVPVVLSRNRVDLLPLQDRLILENPSRLHEVPEAADAACARNVRYVYHGSAGTPDVHARPERMLRHFPSVDELRRSPSLEEVFTSGEAVVFRVNLACFRPGT
jgi:hypothetical protein